ncbi:MAG: tetrathionate reductase family octaheme c-type cytochrome [Planctomycetales bacterium]|nr:tetrathionate reductase family octaheme c-type cytochrome [Planctomycetales bacterium]
MQRIVFVLAAIALMLTMLAVGKLRREVVPPMPLETLRAKYAQKPQAGVDHAKLDELQGPFESPQQVTETCLKCHTERGAEVLASSHWNWQREEFIAGHGIRAVGKKNVLNNFCVGVSSNLQACDKCHAGYGYTSADFDFEDPSRIDCLICHDNSGSYVKSGSGMPAPSVDLTLVAQHVGRTSRANCGTCHFFGGGGNNVKHGDLEQSLFAPTREIDVHMATDGANLECADCHTTVNHKMQGKLYSISSMNRNRSSCVDCHSDMPHEDGILNEHTLKVACQTCHIPHYAKDAPTKIAWDWSTAGKLKDGQPYDERDQDGNVTYMSEKGSFTWGQNLEPEYVWFDGTAQHYLLGDKATRDAPIEINALQGDYRAPNAKIIPAKIHRGRQLYDPQNETLIQPKLVAAKEGEGAFWKDFDWGPSAAAGMAAAGLPYSGEYEFADTEMTWPINHMVAPKEQSLSCSECHTRDGSRIANLTDFYLPGRDRNLWVDRLGGAAMALALIGSLTHGGARWLSRRRKGASQR